MYCWALLLNVVCRLGGRDGGRGEEAKVAARLLGDGRCCLLVVTACVRSVRFAGIVDAGIRVQVQLIRIGAAIGLDRVGLAAPDELGTTFTESSPAAERVLAGAALGGDCSFACAFLYLSSADRCATAGQIGAFQPTFR